MIILGVIMCLCASVASAESAIDASGRFARSVRVSRHQDRDQGWDRQQDRPQDRDRHQDRDKDGYQDRHHDRDQGWDRQQDREQDRDRHQDRDKDRYQDRDQGWDRQQDREQDRDRHQDRDKDRYQDRHQDRDQGWDRQQDREQDQDRHQDRDRDEDRDKDRFQIRHQDRDRDQDRDKERYQDRHQDTDRDQDRDSDEAEAGYQGRKITNGIGSCRKTHRVCTNSPYRTYDGSCNNPNDPNLGSSNTPQKRLFRPDYCNGHEPRGCFRSFLPNPRDVSAQLHFDRPLTFPSITAIFASFGQFLTHDVVNTPISTQDQDCCLNPNQPGCWAIPDNFNRDTGRQCISFSQSGACFENRVKQILNDASSFIDGSQIYGSTPTRARALRSGMKGCLLMNNVFLGFPPSVNQTAGLSRDIVQGQFISGDDRINIMPELGAIHTLFLREHNRIAMELHRLTGWNDEKCYQEARSWWFSAEILRINLQKFTRIVIAELQSVIYSEYLPTVLGKQGMVDFGLDLGDYCTRYNQNVDPSILLEFSTCINRFGHSLIRQYIPKVNPVTKMSTGWYSNSNEYFQHRQLTERRGAGFEEIVAGLCQANSQLGDPYCVPAITRDLFRGPNDNFGSDLIARNIQRGRDHGLPGYNALKKAVGQEPVNAQNPPSDMNPLAWENLVKVYYPNVDMIDCITGLLHELPLPGAAVGSLGYRIQGEQYRRSKDGDRHFFSHCGNFKEAQRMALQKRTLGDIICQNSQQSSIQENVFLVPSKYNPWLSCHDPSRSFLNLARFVQ